LSKHITTLFLVTHIHLARCLASIINLSAVTAYLLTSHLHCRERKKINWNTNYFRYL